MSISITNWRRLTSLLLAPLYMGLGGCQSWENFVKTPQQEAVELRGPTPHRNMTPMEGALACLRQAAPNAGGYRIGVAEFVDGTGSIEGLAMNSRVFSQRPDYMMIVGLKSSGVHLVNRSSVNVAEWEMKQAMEQKLGDGRPVRMDHSEVLFRPIQAGAILGSTHYVTGAITEMNWNISSNLAEGSAFGASAGGRTYRVSLAVDVMVTNTLTTEVVHARSYKKQLVGYETEAGFFRFIEKNQALGYSPYGAVVNKALELFQANIGDKTNEPNQTALRWVIELAAYDVVRSLTRRGTECDSYLPPGSLDLDLPGGGIGPNPEPVLVSSKGPRWDRRRADAAGAQGVKQPVVATATSAPAPVATRLAGDPELSVPAAVRSSAESQYAAKIRNVPDSPTSSATPAMPAPSPVSSDAAAPLAGVTATAPVESTHKAASKRGEKTKTARQGQPVAIAPALADAAPKMEPVAPVAQDVTSTVTQPADASAKAEALPAIQPASFDAPAVKPSEEGKSKASKRGEKLKAASKEPAAAPVAAMQTETPKQESVAGAEPKAADPLKETGASQGAVTSDATKATPAQDVKQKATKRGEKQKVASEDPTGSLSASSNGGKPAGQPKLASSDDESSFSTSRPVGASLEAPSK